MQGHACSVGSPPWPFRMPRRRPAMVAILPRALLSSSLAESRTCPRGFQAVAKGAVMGTRFLTNSAKLKVVAFVELWRCLSVFHCWWTSDHTTLFLKPLTFHARHRVRLHEYTRPQCLDTNEHLIVLRDGGVDVSCELHVQRQILRDSRECFSHVMCAITHCRHAGAGRQCWKVMPVAMGEHKMMGGRFAKCKAHLENLRQRSQSLCDTLPLGLTQSLRNASFSGTVMACSHV